MELKQGFSIEGKVVTKVDNDITDVIYFLSEDHEYLYIYNQDNEFINKLFLEPSGGEGGGIYRIVVES